MQLQVRNTKFILIVTDKLWVFFLKYIVKFFFVQANKKKLIILVLYIYLYLETKITHEVRDLRLKKNGILIFPFIAVSSKLDQ